MKDDFEDVNVASAAEPALLKQLATKLREAFGDGGRLIRDAWLRGRGEQQRHGQRQEPDHACLSARQPWRLCWQRGSCVQGRASLSEPGRW